MKKLFSIVLIMVLILSCSATAFAAPATNVEAAIEKADDYYFWTYFYDGYFEKGEDPDADAVYGILSWLESETFKTYNVEGNEGVPSDVSHMIPAADYEALVAKHFVLTDTLVAELESDSERYQDGYYYYYIGGWGDLIPDYVYQGYKDLGNGEIEIYAYEAFLLDDTTYEEYVPGPEDVEGKDYLFVLDTYIDEMTGELVTAGYPKKILSTLVSTFKIDGKNVVMTSYTSKDKAIMPSADEFTDTKAPVKEDIVIDFEYGVFEPGTQVTCAPVTDDATLEQVKDALDDVAKDFVVFDANAVYREEAVQPNGTVKITFAVPDGYSDNLAVFFIAEDGTIEEIESTYDPATNTVTAVLEHFSLYALVDLGADDDAGDVTPPGDGDQDNDGNTNTGNNGTTEGDGKAPEKDTGVPPTADNNNLGLWLAVALLAGGLALGLKKRTN